MYANSFPLGLFGTPLVAATFNPCAMHDANTPLDGSVSAHLVAAMFSLCALPDANAPLLGYDGVPLAFAF